MKKDLNKKLQTLGLSEEKSAIYLALLREGSCGASRLSRIVNRPKSSVLDDLKDLAKEGFVARRKKKNAYLFDVDPSRLKEVFSKKREEIKRLEERAENLEAELRSIYQPPSKKPQIKYLEGQEGIKEAFEDTLKVPGEEILGYGTVEPQLWSVPKLFPEYYSIRAKQRIAFRGLLPTTPKTLDECWSNDQGHLRQSCFIGLDKFSPIEVNVYRDTVSIMSLYELFAVMIRSKDVADCFRHVFELAIKGAQQEHQEICEDIKKRGLDQVKQDNQEFYKHGIME